MNKNLREQENKMLEWLDKNNLVRVINHHRDTNTGSVTFCNLYDKTAYYDAKKDDSIGVITQSSGSSECSSKDNFNKALGRVIATGRAIKLYKNIHTKTIAQAILDRAKEL